MTVQSSSEPRRDGVGRHGINFLASSSGMKDLFGNASARREKKKTFNLGRIDSGRSQVIATGRSFVVLSSCVDFTNSLVRDGSAF